MTLRENLWAGETQPNPNNDGMNMRQSVLKAFDEFMNETGGSEVSRKRGLRLIEEAFDNPNRLCIVALNMPANERDTVLGILETFGYFERKAA